MERGEQSNNLPPEPWMSVREHQFPPDLVDHLGNQAVCSSRESTECQSPFFSHGTVDSRFRENVHVPSTSIVQPFGLISQTAHTSRPVTTNNSSQPVSDRSAWTHLLSLDPSLAYGSQTSNQPQLASYGHPLFEIGNVDRPVSDHSLIGQHFDLLSDNLTSMNTSTSMSHQSAPYTTSMLNNNFHQRSLATHGHQPVSQHLNQLINLSRDAGNFSSASATTDNHTDGLLEPGGYSPVSPPSQDSSTPPAALHSGRVAELLKRDSPSPVSFSASSANNFNYTVEKQVDSFMKTPTSLQLMTSEMPRTFQDPQSYSAPSDVPLDMTKAFPSKDEAQDMSVSKKANHLTSSLTGDILMENSGMDFEIKANQSLENSSKVPLTLPNKPCLENISNIQLSSGRQLKPAVRSTPKKSNFYGRDASLFSFPNEPLSQSHSSVVPISSAQHHNDVLSVSASSVPDLTGSPTSQVDGSEKPLVAKATIGPFSALGDVTSVHASISSDCDSSTSNFADSFIDASIGDCEAADNISELLKPDSFHPSGVNEAKSSSNSYRDRISASGDMPKCTVDLTQIDNVDVQQDRSASALLADPVSETSSNVGSAFVPAFAAENQNDSLMTTSHDEIDLEMEVESAKADDSSDTIISLPPVVKPIAKRKRRKGSGFQTRQRRRGKKLQTSASQLPPSNSIAPNADLGTTAGKKVLPSKPVRRRRKKAAATAAVEDDATDAAPRRSSSRKSKDNAMRLIELQADSSYGYTSQVISEEPPLPPPPPLPHGKKRGITKKSARVKSDDGKLSDDSPMNDEDTDQEDEQDAEYAPDEEEFQEDLSPSEEGKGKNMKGRKVGGLKISIKLGTENLAQIVSNIRHRPSNKKRKGPSRKLGKTKFKSQAIINDDEEEDEEEGDLKKGKESASDQDTTFQSESSTATASETQERESKTLEHGSETQEHEQKSEVEDKEKTLLDKYFNAANAVSKQINKEKPLKKPVQLKKSKAGKASKPKLAMKNIKGESLAADVINKNLKLSSDKSAVKFDSTAQADKNKAGVNSNVNTGGEVPKFVCGYCPKRYHNKDELMAHMEAHMAEMESKAGNKNAKEVKKTVSATVKRMKMPSNAVKMSQGPQKMEHKCGECGQVFPSKSSLLEHVGTHTADKPFECNLCHKCFKDRDLLSVHRKTHNQEGLVRCPICSKGFIHEPDLVRHIRTHPKRSTPLVPLKRKIAAPPEKNIKSTKISSSGQGKEQVRAKPTSFASALSGEEEGLTDKKLKVPTILLKRGEVLSPLSSHDSGKSPKTAGLLTATSQSPKSAKPFETGDIKTHSSSAKLDNNSTPKDVTNKADGSVKESGKKGDSSSKESVRKPEDKVENKSVTTTNPNPGHCTCKECPECVTRFLQSFY